MKKGYLLFFSLIVLLFGASGCSADGKTQNKQDSAKERVELTISAAASLQDALAEIKAGFEKEHPAIILNFNFGGSGALQQQITQGAPVDLFFSAAEDKFQALVKDGLIEKESGRNLLGNDLVLIVPKDSEKEIKTFEDLTDAGKIALGTPESVPAGKYGKETLEHLNVWEDIEDKDDFVFAKDVRQVLTYVETGNVDAGIVYKTDAMASEKVDIAATAGDDSHAPIIYPVGIIKNTPHPNEAKLFFEYLQNNQSMKIFEEYGFKGLN